uniref:Uncharacterized protein n=1 Tax=Plectus sambesii TaxID=2011161 RepID=A0A914VVS3_9BILA
MRILRTLHKLSSLQVRHASYRIGCASGFWGDTAVSTRQLVHSDPPVDVIAYDYLAEITMSILARMKAKDPKLGYCPDFALVHLASNLREIKKRGIKIVSNAGGLNPLACAQQISQMAQEQGIELKVAAITGDDLSSLTTDQIRAKLPSSDALPEEVDQSGFASVNAYFGAKPIARALEAGADIVVTGRCVDSALVLGPLAHRFKWDFAKNFDALANGSLAGHLIECGTQCTGGMFTDWHKVPHMENIGFPIAEFDDATNATEFVLTKPNGTGGLVSFGTAAEQLIYEIGDPNNYLLPDVNADFSQVRIEDIAGRENAVKISGARSTGRPTNLKATGTYMSGYRCTAMVPIMGANPLPRAEKSAKAILDRCRLLFRALKLGDVFTRTNIQVIGARDCQGRVVENAGEACLWLSVHHQNRKALEFSPVLMHHGFLWPRETAKADIYINGQLVESVTDSANVAVSDATDSKHCRNATAASLGDHKYRLMDLAYARSGDKGDMANIGVVCRDPKYYDALKQTLTAEVVADYFSRFLKDASLVKRYEMPGIHALNFILPQSLGGGGVASLRCDPQGKGYAQMLLDMTLTELPDFGKL